MTSLADAAIDGVFKDAYPIQVRMEQPYAAVLIRLNVEVGR